MKALIGSATRLSKVMTAELAVMAVLGSPPPTDGPGASVSITTSKSRTTTKKSSKRKRVSRAERRRQREANGLRAHYLREAVLCALAKGPGIRAKDFVATLPESEKYNPVDYRTTYTVLKRLQADKQVENKDGLWSLRAEGETGAPLPIR